MTDSALKQSKIGMVVRVTSGNFLEMFDFFLMGIYASYIAKAFFPREERIRVADAYICDLWSRLS